MEPCGTPVVIMSGSDTDPLMQAIWVRLSREERNQFKQIPEIP